MDEEKKLIEFYKKYADENGIKLNPDEKIVRMIVKGILRNKEKYGENYCPCRRVSGNKEADKPNICPCAYHMDEIKKDGHCHCLLFVKKDE
ncbi:ferredoxin:thioredoxin reductase [Candidatus Woesearchaeota archaeon]|nr:ferredoxin:thioredoxin reductase [Candidatus Woesearchaeota archaeon]